MRRILALGGAIAVFSALFFPGVALAGPPSSTEPDNRSASGVLASHTRVPVLVTLNAQADATEAREDTLLAQQAKLLQDWGSRYGIEVDRQFGYLLSGFSATMPSSKIAALRSEPTVASVREQRLFYPALATAGDLVQAGTVWEDLGVDGEGMVIAIIDSGIDPAHRDMRLDDFSQAAIQDVKPGGAFTEKVPWGYNYADRNDQIVDQDPTQHGMHVAGIAAANGGEDASIEGNGRVNGMAPEAQLLAMKVFSNAPDRRNQAFEADIVAAVEDSVRHGADVINMSLGSANGFDSADYGLNRAIETASEQGVLVVVAAGNEGLRNSLDGTTWDLDLYRDNGTVGGPSTSASALSVASVENGTVVSPTVTAGAQGTADSETFPYALQQGDLPGMPVELFDGGLGYPEDFQDEDGQPLAGLAGKYALVKRGDLSFTEKVTNAGDAGAAGVVLWNHEQGGDDTFGALIESPYTFTVVSVGFSGGQFTQQLLEANGNASMAFSDAPVVQPNAAASTPSSFTSWGVTPDLEIKPEIAGIGGNVYSTLNGDRYGNMSGTSMASPQVAGLSALLLSELGDRYPELDQSQVNELLRLVLSNTAEPVADQDGMPFPVRQQGAGLAQAADALATSVTASSDGAPSVALKDFTGSKQFSVTLRNLGDTAQEFSVETPAVLTEEVSDYGDLGSVESACGDSLAAAQDTVQVPAGGEAVVEFEIGAGNGCDPRFVEGWIGFVATASEQPDLSVPYLGYVGDWGEEDIFDTGLWGSLFDDPYMKTQLGVSDGWDIYAYDPEDWFTADSAGTQQILLPALFSLRNATEIQYELLDASGALVQKLGYDREVPAPLMALVYNGLQSPYNLPDWGFDGLQYDKGTGTWVPAVSGDYTMRVKARVNDAEDMQQLDFPFKLDADAPELTVLDAVPEGSDLIVRVQVDDAHSGPVAVEQWGEIMGLEIATGGGFVMPSSIESSTENQAVFEVRFTDAAERGWAVLRGWDRAGNLSEPLTYFFDDYALLWHNADDFERGFADDTYSIYLDDTLVQDGRVPMVFTVGNGIKSLEVGDQLVTPAANGPTTVWVPFQVGHNPVTVRALDEGGTVRFEQEVDVFYHPNLPTIADLQAVSVLADIWGDGEEIAALKVTGCVADEMVPAQDLTVWIAGWDAFPGEDGCFEAVVPDEDWISGPAPALVLWYVDNGVSAIAGYVPVEGRQAAATWQDMLKLSNVDLQGGIHFVNHWDQALTEAEDGSATYLISGRFNVAPGAFSIGGQSVEVSSDLSFAHEVALEPGVTSVNVYLETADGRVVNDTSLRLLYSPSLPELSFDSPRFHNGQLFVPQASGNEVVFSGEIADQTFGHTLWINGDMVSSYADITAPGEELTRKSFEYQSTMAAGEIITINVLDAISREAELQIPVVLDDVAPVVQSGLADGDVVTESRTVELTAFDANLIGFDAAILDKSTMEPVDVEFDTQYEVGEDGVTASTSFDPAELPAGSYLLVVGATDAAGNTSDLTQTFHVPGPSAVTIEGPDAIEVEEGQPVVLADHWTVPEGYELSAALDNLMVGDNAVRIQVLDGQGVPVGQRDVVITVIRGLSTLTDGRVSVTARFAPEDALTATWNQVSDSVEEFSIDHGSDPLTGKIAVEVPKTLGVKVLRMPGDEQDARRSLQAEITFEVVDGKLVFDGMTPGTYRIVYPVVPGVDGGNGDGSGQGITKPGGELSATGANGALGLTVAAALLLAAGTGVALLSRKRGGGRHSAA